MRLNEAGRTVGREMYNYNTMPPSYRKYIVSQIKKKYNCSDEEAIGRLKQNATWRVSGDRGNDGSEHELYSVGHGDEYISSLMHKQLENYDKEMDQQILLAENITSAYNHAADIHFDRALKASEEAETIATKLTSGGTLTDDEATRYKTIATNLNMISGSIVQLQELYAQNLGLAKYLSKTVIYGTEESPEWMRKVVQARIKYNDMMIKLLDTMVKENYTLLDMTKDQAMFCSEQLNSPDKNARSAGIKQAKEAVLAAVEKNPDKYKKGNAIDLRPLGAGVMFLCDNYLDSGLEQYTSLDRMVQDLLQYDAICVGHGSADGAGERAALKMAVDEREAAGEKYQKLLDELRERVPKIRTRTFAKLIKRLDPKSEAGEQIQRVIKTYFDTGDKFDAISDDMPPEERDKIAAKYYEALNNMEQLTDNIFKSQTYFQSLNMDEPEEVKKAVQKIKEIEKKADEAEDAYYTFKTDFDKLYKRAERINRKAGKKGIKGEWVIDPVRTLSGGPFTDPNELIRQLIKEGFKNILLNQCNPGHHKLAEDILKRKDVMVTYSNNTYLLENADMNELDPAWSEMIQRLDENYVTMATAVRAWHPEYATMTLHECAADIDDICESYALNEASSLNEASLKDAWSKIVELLKRGAAFIGKLFMALIKRIKSFIMKIVDFFKRIFRSLKEKRMTGKMTRKIKSCAVSASGKAKANTFQFDDWKTIEQNFAKHNQALQAEIERKSKEVDKVLKDMDIFLEKQVKSSQSAVSESCTVAQAEALFNLIML